jgi:hypothetical protein
MTVQELIELLETAPSDAKVLFAHQPAWPLYVEVESRFLEVDDDDEQLVDSNGSPVIYLIESSTGDRGYAPVDIT